MNRGKKRKGRPPKNKAQISESTPEKPSIPDSTTESRRSARWNHNRSQLHSEDDYEYEDDEDERKEKKVKLVVRLPNESEEKVNEKVRNLSSEDVEVNRKRKICGSEDEISDQEKRFAEAEDTPLHGSQLESGPTTPLVDKKWLVFILDRLQKKDTYGVFSKPVDPEELPDYFDIIDKPMDFGTVRKKVDSGTYRNLEELEADVFLICSNAMQYNSPDTVYYRQARTIQELAKRDFENLRHEGDDGEPQPKVVRRGRPPSNKNQKKIVEEKPVESPATDRVGTELSSGATLATVDEKATESSAYNLRKASTSYKFQPSDPFMSSYRSRVGENHSEWTSDWSDFPAHILRADMKYGKKHFTVDENRRDTYRPSHQPSSGNNSTVSSNNVGDLRRLVPIGLQDPLAYARSLARFAANISPLAWKIASKKIECVLPPGTKYGPGWVGDNGSTNTQLYSFSSEKQKLPSNNMGSDDTGSSKLILSPTPTSRLNPTNNAYVPSANKMAEAVKKLNDQNELAGNSESSSWRAQLLARQNLVHQPYRNGFSPMFGYNNFSLPGHSVSGVAVPQMEEKTSMNGVDEGAKLQESTAQENPTGQGSSSSNGNNVVDSRGEVEARNIGNAKWQSVPNQQMCNNKSLSVPPDLNVRIAASSPSSSSLQIGSPQQPDLALQL